MILDFYDVLHVSQGELSEQSELSDFVANLTDLQTVCFLKKVNNVGIILGS